MFRKRTSLALIAATVLALLIYFCLPQHPGIVARYDNVVFYPIQWIRDCILGIVPFSVGDIIYVVAGAALAVSICRLVYYLFRYRSCGEQAGRLLTRLSGAALFVYLLFIFGWGANYYKPSIARSWGLAGDTTIRLMSREAFREQVRTDLIAFDSFLVSRINIYAPHYQSLSFREINKRAAGYYAQHTDSRLKPYGLGIKPTMFGWFMERLGVEGYYNPFTGEGQINSSLPRFIMPFLVCHEMAHQAGIAAEGDANLMAYAVCTASPDSTFRYSAYFEIWLYTNRRLYYRDSTAADRLESILNPFTSAQIDTLEELARKYDNDYARYSSEVFDSYLKMNDQKEGIRSYTSVAATAWRLERERDKRQPAVIHIP